jgi:hypothetical protein
LQSEPVIGADQCARQQGDQGWQPVGHGRRWPSYWAQSPGTGLEGWGARVVLTLLFPN